MSLSKFYANKTILVTGHTGFKGSWLSLWLQQLKANVIGYSLEPPTNPNLFESARIRQNMKSIIGNICNYQFLLETINKYQPDMVFHLAAQALVIKSYDDPLETFATNIIGTANILEAIKNNGKVKTVVNVTSDKCYENLEMSKSFVEDDRLGGSDPYSCSKASAELIIKSYRNSFFKPESYNNPSIISSVRAGNVIGGGDWAENRLIPDCVKALIKDKKIIIRNPNSTRPWQHVLEPLSGYLQLAKKMYLYGNEFEGPWNFGPYEEEVKNVKYIAKKICTLWGKPESLVIKKDNNLPHESKYLSLNSSKSNKILGWKPILKLNKSLEMTVDWYQTYYKEPELVKSKMIKQISDYNDRL